MKSRFAKLEGILLRLAILIAVVFPPLIPAQLGASAQGNSSPIRVVRSLYTNEYGVTDPKGLAFSPAANTFFVLNQSGNITFLTMGEDNAGTRNLPEVQNDPLNVAFDKKSGGLFVFNRGKSELVKIKSDDKGLPDASTSPIRYAVYAFGIKDPQGIAFDPDSGRLFVLDAGKSQIVSVVPHPTLGFDGDEAIRSNKVQRISLNKLGIGLLKGLAYNPGNGHLYVSEPSQKKLYELTQNGNIVSTFDLASLGINNPSAMTFAPSVDNTDDPNIYDLFVLDDGQTAKTGLFSFTSTRQQTSSANGQIVELSLAASMALPPGTTLMPATLVRTFDTSVWNHPSPDPSGIDYWPLTGQLMIDDSEIEESVGGNPPVYWHGFNIFQSTLAGNLVGNCTTFTSNPTSLVYNNFTNEPSGFAINPSNNHFFISSDGSNSRVHEVGPGADGVYCTPDDTVTRTLIATLYGATDAEDVAYGDNTLFVSDGVNAEVYSIPLGAGGVLGGGDDGPVTQFDTAALGFTDLEGIAYNSDAGTLFIVSTAGSENYLGEVTTSGSLIRAYDLSFMGTVGNIRSGVTYAPGSQNLAIKNIYIVSRGVDNNANPNDNDGEVWEINISSPGTPAPSRTPTITNTPTIGAPPTNTSTLTFTPTFTAIAPTSGNTFYSSFADDGTVGGVAFGDEDILEFNGSTWSLFFDGSDVGLTTVDVFAFYNLDANTILMSFNTSITLNGVTFAPTDIAQFDATSLGATTAGTFSMYFNGVDVGLSVAAENIDALDVLPDGKVLISTVGNPTVTGVTGAADEDILAFTPTTLGTTTSGTWALYFDGSDVGLADTGMEDIDALDVAPNGNIYLSTIGLFSVTGVSGDDEDVFVCTPSSLGSVTACTYSSVLYFDGSTWAQTSNDVDGFNLLNTGPFPTATFTNTPLPVNTFTHTPTATNTYTPTIGSSLTPSYTPTASSPPTATSTSGGSDLIFADGFESGSFSAWTSNANDLGDLGVSPAAALVGGQGMQALIDDANAIYVNDDSPNAEPRYRVRFYFDPNSISMASGDAHFIFKGFSGTSTDVLQVEFRNSLGAYQIRAKLLNDSSAFVNTNWFTIIDASHFIELNWQAATAAGANNGGLTLWIDGVQQADLTNVDNDTWRVDRVRLGALAGMDAGTSGTYYFDAFESRRQNYIGP